MDSPAGDSAVYCTLIIKPFRLDPVLSALELLPIDEVIVTEVRGYGRQRGHLELYRGAEYVISFVPKLKLEFGLPTSRIDELVACVSRAARTGRIGDGKLFIQSCDTATE